MEIKEVRYTEEGFEVTLSWSNEEVEEGGYDYGWWLRSLLQHSDSRRLFEVYGKKLEEAEA